MNVKVNLSSTTWVSAGVSSRRTYKTSCPQHCAGRREVLLVGGLSFFTALGAPVWAADEAYSPAKIRLDLAPDQSKYNAADEDLRDAAGKLQLALNAENVKVHPNVPPSFRMRGFK